MTWNWFRHSNEFGDVLYSMSRKEACQIDGVHVRTRPATEEEIEALEEKYG